MLKISKKVMLCGSMLALAGCASYSASMLAPLPIETALQSYENPKVLVSSRVYDQNDSETYLGRDLLAEGYVPVQMTIRNNSSDPMYLNPSNFNIALPLVSEVANKVHTSTAGRVMGWGIPGLFIWPFLIPAVYDGIKSKEANAELDADYAAKAIKEQTIQPYTSFTSVVFVPKTASAQGIELFLVNQRTNEKVLCPLINTAR